MRNAASSSLANVCNCHSIRMPMTCAATDTTRTSFWVGAISLYLCDYSRCPPLKTLPSLAGKVSQ